MIAAIFSDKLTNATDQSQELDESEIKNGYGWVNGRFAPFKLFDNVLIISKNQPIDQIFVDEKNNVVMKNIKESHQ